MNMTNENIPSKANLENLFLDIENSIDAGCKVNFFSFTDHLYKVVGNQNLSLKERNYWQFQVKETNDILSDCRTGDHKSLTLFNEMFYKNLEFGTGGMRGIIGPGTNRINLFTIGKATQGFASWLKAEAPGPDALSAVIAYDSRHLSRELAEKSALILAAAGIKGYLFDKVAPTPLLSFAVRELKASGGIVVTASHNPPQYNGYKVYRWDGCQVPPPKDMDIIGFVEKEKGYAAISKKEALERGLFEILENSMDNAYLEKLSQSRLWEKNENIRAGYSALHGTGARLVPRVIREFGFGDLKVVESQREPDGDFPTVEYPNPEDPRALEVLIAEGKKNDLEILMANDPDADRVGICVKGGNEFILLNGNQTGALLEYYFLERMQEKNAIPENGVIIKTIVTTELQRKIAESFNVRLIDTLTGFKYIGDWMSRLDSDGSGKYIFGGEESYGYLPVDFVRDKDGISSCYFIMESANYYKSRGRTLLDQMEEIYKRYGLFHERLFSQSFPGKTGMEKMNAIMEYARANSPSELGKIEIQSVYDIQKRQRLNLKSGQIEPDLNLPVSNVIQYDLVGGGKVTLRPSGTEPKIKFYFSVSKKMKGGDKSEDILPELDALVEAMMDDLRNKIINPNL